MYLVEEILSKFVCFDQIMLFKNFYLKANLRYNKRHGGIKGDEFYIQDSQSTVLNQFFMLTFSYKFNTLGSKGIQVGEIYTLIR